MSSRKPSQSSPVSRRHTGALLLAALAGSASFPLAQAQSAAWPDKPVRIVVPFQAGGATDLLARAMATTLGKSLGQSFIVDNRSGANGNLGASFVATSPPDGYTLLLTTNGPLALNKFMYKSTPYDSVKDFTPIAKVAEIPMLIAAHPSVPVKDVRELIAYAKAQPGKLTYATTGLGSMGNLTALVFQQQNGIKLTHIPYNGGPQVAKDLLAGVVNLSFDLAPTYAQHVASGKLHALAVTTAQRSALFPQTPTFSEQGIKNFQPSAWIALLGPAGLPPEVTRKLGDATNAFLVSPEGKEALLRLGMQATGGTPAQLADYIRSEIATWKPIAESVTVE